MDYKRLVNYWLKTAEHDFGVMSRLFNGKDYAEAIFFGQLVLEKVLKAKVVMAIKKQAPRIHDLSRLAQLADMEVDQEATIFLDEMTRFNLEARYPDYRLKIYKLANKSFTEPRLKKVKNLYEIYKKNVI